MQRTNWFDRKFSPITDNGLFPTILERLEGTPARLTDKINRMQHNLTLSLNGKWSIQKEVGHLIDLEPLWRDRALQIIDNQSNLIAADLTNRKTHETDYDSMDMAALLAQFSALRSDLMAVLRSATNEDLEKAAIHPRLGTPMKLIDLAYFVAEHDDHHLAQMTLLSGNN
ncbi:MAG: DinB family protein [Saprospiraceae bacterium]|nr:DinB family protein [Saprospiraceae bacterium]